MIEMSVVMRVYHSLAVSAIVVLSLCCIQICLYIDAQAEQFRKEGHEML